MHFGRCQIGAPGVPGQQLALLPQGLKPLGGAGRAADACAGHAVVQPSAVRSLQVCAQAFRLHLARPLGSCCCTVTPSQGQGVQENPGLADGRYEPDS